MSRSSRRAFLGTLGAAAVALPELSSHAIRVTLAPTKVFKFPATHGTLETGVTADVTVIDLQEGNFELIDQQNNKRTAKRKIVPVATVHGGTLVKIDPKVHESAPHAGLRM